MVSASDCLGEESEELKTGVGEALDVASSVSESNSCIMMIFAICLKF
ncbi:hypothetical protein NIES298_10780 [Microcystis aeruginosa NIES-298]|nr:hypothetical protein NIES298_10780 [Microcystis aeruginosa NIES-298]